MTTTTNTRSTPTTKDRTPQWIAAATFLAHAAVAGRYGFFRDELYFIDCGRHPAFGYVDQPPLVPLIAAATQVFGPHLFLLRCVPAVAHAALVLVTALLARLVAEETGLNPRFGPALAALSVALAPMYLGIHTTLNTTCFEPLAWTTVAYLIVLASVRARPADLVYAGLVSGLAMEAKYALPFFLAPLLLGVALSPARRVLVSKHAAIAVVLAGALAAPSAIWQLRHQMPFLELMRAAGDKNTHVSVGAFVLNQFVTFNILLAPIWLAGLGASLFSVRFARVRCLGFGFAGVFLEMILLHGKDYYVAPAYAGVFAVGSVVIASAITGTLARVLYVAAALGVSVVAAPLAMPILDPPALAAYVRRLPIGAQVQEKSVQESVLPQSHADMLGWTELEAKVAEVWRALPAEDRANVAIITSNYGEAGALNFFGPADGLPRALSGHNQYFLWGTQGHDGGVVLRINGNLDRWKDRCREVTVAATFGTPYAVPYENHRAILLCRGMKSPLPSLWEEDFKHYE